MYKIGILLLIISILIYNYNNLHLTDDFIALIIYSIINNFKNILMNYKIQQFHITYNKNAIFNYENYGYIILDYFSNLFFGLFSLYLSCYDIYANYNICNIFSKLNRVWITIVCYLNIMNIYDITKTYHYIETICALIIK